MLERRFAGDVTLDGRHVDEAQAVLLMAHMALFLEGAQKGANGGVARRVGDAVEDFSGGRAAAGEEEVHDLPLAAAQRALGHRTSASARKAALLLEF